MRKHWLYWIGGGSSKSAKRGRFTRESSETPQSPPTPPNGCMCLQIFDLNHFHFPLVQNQQLSSKHDDDSGLLQDDIDHEPTISKGVEAPRNSLELEETMSSYEGATSSVSSTMKEANLNITMGIQVRTSCESKSPRESTSECSSSSPGTKTPGVVARLMGLDLLPEDASSPSSSRFSTPTASMKSRLQHHYSAGNQNEEDRARNLLKNKSKNGTRSLPETPRGSSSSDRRSDVEQCRLSLQIINKEGGSNNGVDEQFDLASYIAKRVIARRREDLAGTSIQEDESRSQRRHYAKQIVKQMKESVSIRKFGHDITNSVTNVVLLKPNNKKSFRDIDQSSTSTSKQSTPSCSPRLRFLEIKNHHKPHPVPNLLPTECQTSHQHQHVPMPLEILLPKQDNRGLGSMQPKISLANKSAEVMQTTEIKPDTQLLQQPQNHLQQKSINICEKVASERYNLHFKTTPPTSGAAIIRTKKEEPFIRSPSKNKDKNLRKFTLSTESLNKNVPTTLHVKNDPPNSPSTTSFHNQGREESNAQSSRKSKQQLHRSLSQSYYSTCSEMRCKNGAKMSSVDGEINIERYDYFQYIQRILKRTGIHPSTPISLAKWYTPSHPLDPAIFHYMELFHHPQISKLNQKSNRKLIFHLADELLAQILKPYVSFQPWVDKFLQISPRMNGVELTGQICSRIEGYPSANCQVLEDIDALIAKDFHESSSSQIEVAFEAEGELIVTEIEQFIMESLVHETAVEVVFRSIRKR